jgi:hypothetical protein
MLKLLARHFALGLLLVSGQAAAQSAPSGATPPPGGAVEPAASVPGAPATPEQKKAAKKDLAAGQKLLKQKSFEEALTKLEAAYAVDPKPETLLGIAEAQKATDRLVEAYRSYDKALRDGATDLKPKDRDAGTRALADLAARTGTVKLSTPDPTALVTLDTRALSADAMASPVRLLPGKHNVSATKDGFEPFAAEVEIEAGKEAAAVEIALKPIVAKKEPVVAAPAPAKEAPPASDVVAAPVVPPGSVVVAPAPVVVAPAPVVVAAAPSAPASPGVRVGLVLGIISLPRPAEAELVVKLGTAFSVGAEFSMLPDLTVPGGSAKLRLMAGQANARWFPFDGAFFLGAGFGYQAFKASLTKTKDNGPLVVTADMSGLFVAPQLGWLWVWRSGFALGLGLGVQIPIPKDPVVSSTYNGQPVPEQAGPGFSQSVVDSAHSQEDTIRTLAKFVVKYPIPTIDLLRLGFFF